MTNKLSLQGNFAVTTSNGDVFTVENATISYETDASVQEIGTLINGVKDILKMINTPNTTPTTTATPIKNAVVHSTGTTTKPEDTIQVSWDLEGVWKTIEAKLPKANCNVKTPKPGFKKKGIGQYEFLNTTDMEDDTRIKFELRDDSIVLSINSNIFVLRENPRHNSVVGIHRSLVPELITSIKDEETRTVVEGFVEKVLKK